MSPLLALTARSLGLLCGLLVALPLFAASLAEIEQRGRLIVLSVPHQESSFVRTNIERGPMKRSGTSEDFVGFDVDVMHAFANHLGVELEIRPAVGEDGLPSYTELFAALERGEGDVIASSTTITENRKRRARFSRPYHWVRLMVVTLEGSPIRSFEDLDGATAAVVSGSSQEEHLRRLGFADDRLSLHEFSLAAYDAVLDDEADFTLVDSNSAHRFIELYSALSIAFEFPESDPYAYAVAPGNDDLLAALDAFLEQLEASGRLAELKAKHLPEPRAR